MGFDRIKKGEFIKDDLLILIGRAKNKGKHIHDAPGLHHLAFSVDSRQAVDQFYSEVLLKMRDVKVEDSPVDCPEYTGYIHSEYYATFFYDPDGVKLEIAYAPFRSF